MFEHVTILLSIIFALAMTHILASATELVWERHKVRFYGLHAVWMVNALLALLCYWVSIWDLTTVKRWTGLEIVFQFLPAIVQYFACSLLSMRREGDEIMDMKAFYERQKPAIFTAFSLMMVTSMIQTYVDRNNLAWPAPSDWIGAELPIFLMLVATLIAGWAKPLWLQWIAGIFIFGLETLFLAVYAVRS
ncbi:MAG TPA: hypothetical protein VNX86_14545 [Rhizomicrobium sp.]|jgi:hypothetical protein|nr:hypothetical protein [Rhizomicrobium sp.]